MFKLINMTITSKKNVAKTPPESNSGSSQPHKDESLTDSETDDIIKGPPLKFQNKNTSESAEPPKTQSNTLKDEISISRDKKNITKFTGEQKSLYSLYLSKIGSGVDRHKDIPEKYAPQKDTNSLKKSINVENFSKETNVHVLSVGTESSTNGSLSSNSSLPSTNQAHLNQLGACSKLNTIKKRPFSSIEPENEQISEKLSKTEHTSSLEITREPTIVSEKTPKPELTPTNTSSIQFTDSKLNSEQIEPNFKKKSKDIPKKVENEYIDRGEMVDVKSKSEDIYEAPIALKEHDYAAIPRRNLKKPSTELMDCNKIIILSSEDVMNAHKATGSDVGARNFEKDESPLCASPAQETTIQAVFPNDTTSILDNVELNQLPDDQNQRSDFNRDDKSQLLTSKNNSKPPENDTSQSPSTIFDRSRQTSNSDQNLSTRRSSKKRACASKSFELKKLKVRLQKIDYVIVKLQKQNSINLDEAGALINGQKYRATSSTSMDGVDDGSKLHKKQLVVARNIEPPFTRSSINRQDANKSSRRQKDQVINVTSTNRVDDNSEPHEKQLAVAQNIKTLFTESQNRSLINTQEGSEFLHSLKDQETKPASTNRVDDNSKSHEKQLVVARNIEAPLTGSQKESSIKTQEASEFLHSQKDRDMNPESMNRADDSKSHENQLIVTRNIEPLITEVQNESSINSQEAIKPLRKQKDRENNSASTSQVDDDSKLCEKQLQTRDIESPFTELQNESATNFCEASQSLNSEKDREINSALTNRVVDTKLHEKQLIEARNIETSFTESLQKQKDQEISLASTSRVDISKTNEKKLQIRKIEPCSTDSINSQEASKFVRRQNSPTSTNRVDEDLKLHEKQLKGAQNIEACLTGSQKESLVKGQEINPTSTNRVDDDSKSYKKQLVVAQNIEALSIALQKGSWINVKKVSKSLQGQKEQEINSASTNQVGDDSKLHETQLVWVGNVEINPASTNQVGDDGKLHKKQLVVARNIETVTEVQHSISAQDFIEPLHSQKDTEMNQAHDSKSLEKQLIAARNMEPSVTEVKNRCSINAHDASKPLHRQKDQENNTASTSRVDDDLKSHEKQLIETRNIKAPFIELQYGSSNSQEASESLHRPKDREFHSASASQQTRNIEPSFIDLQNESSIIFQGASKSLHSQKDQEINFDSKNRNDSKLHKKQLIKAQNIEVSLNELQYESSNSQEVGKSLHRQKDREINSESKNRVDDVSKSHEKKLARNIESSFTELRDGISNSQEASKSLHTQNDREIVSTSKNQTDDVSKMHEKQLVWAQNIEPSLIVIRDRSSNSQKASKSLHRQKERENDTPRSISNDKIGADSNSSRNIESNAQNIEPSAQNIEPSARNSLQNEQESLQDSEVQSTVPDIGKLESKTITNRSDDLENGSKVGTSIFNREKPTETKNITKHSKKGRNKQTFSTGDDSISNVESLGNNKRNRVSESKKQLQTSSWSSYVLDDTTISEIKKSSEMNKKMNKLKSDSGSTSSGTKTMKNKRKGKRNNVDEPKTKTIETRDLKTSNEDNAVASPSVKDAGKNKRLRSKNDEEDLNIKKLKISDDENSSSSSIHKDADEDFINPNIKIEDVTIQQLEEYASLEIKAENLSKCSSDSQEFCSLNITSSQFLPDVQVKSEENISEILRKYVSRVEVEDSSLSDDSEQELFFSLEEK